MDKVGITNHKPCICRTIKASSTLYNYLTFKLNYLNYKMLSKKKYWCNFHGHKIRWTHKNQFDKEYETSSTSTLVEGGDMGFDLGAVIINLRIILSLAWIPRDWGF